MKATEQYFPVVLFIMLYKVVLTCESVDEILHCDYSNESSPVLLIWYCLFFKTKFKFFLNMDFVETSISSIAYITRPTCYLMATMK